MSGTSFVYVGDPMCSWCWGFAPVVSDLEEELDIPVRVVVGGLRPGPAAEPLDDQLGRFLEHHWEQVEELSGQPFNREFLREREGWIYDTEPACRAVVAVRDLKPEAALPFFARLQEAFYVENRDVTAGDVLADVADEAGLDRAGFAERFHSEEIRQQTAGDFRWARARGVTGFPTLLLEDGDVLYLVTRGYAPLDPIRDAIGRWREGRSAG